FNLGLNTDYEMAEKNWFKMKSSFEKAQYFLPVQIHSNNVQFADEDKGSKFYSEECDAYLIQARNTAFAAVTVADCVPLVLFSEKQEIIGAIHAGWRGLYNGIIENMISLIKEKSFELNDITWVIGPHASECCYEVSEDIYNDFSDKYSIEPGRISDNSHFLSLKSVIYRIFENNGVNRVHDVNKCTICDPIFYSYRRSRGAAGRFAGFIYKR
ncbi:polyphenol oxidase family protein, partial [bacterium]|nr:polyphenol oxidase family protein [bacterium]